MCGPWFYIGFTVHCRFWLRFAPGIFLLSLNDTERPVRAWQWVRNTFDITHRQTTILWWSSINHNQRLSPCRWEQTCLQVVWGAGRQLLLVRLWSQFAVLCPQPAAPCPETSGQPHRAATFWEPSPWQSPPRAGRRCHHHASASGAGHLCQSHNSGWTGEGGEFFEGTKPSCLSGTFHTRSFKSVCVMFCDVESSFHRMSLMYVNYNTCWTRHHFSQWIHFRKCSVLMNFTTDVGQDPL